MFGKGKKIDSGVKKVDKLVTGIIIGGAVASIFGLSKTKKGKEVSRSLSRKVTSIFYKSAKKTLGGVGKTLAFFVGIFNKK